MMNIAVDAMGGDHAPAEIVKGTVQAVAEYDVNVILVGDQEAIRRELAVCGATNNSRITVQHAEQEITMEDQPSVVVRGKRNSSIHEGLRLVKDGSADAFFSAGNTGAVMAVSKLILRTLDKIDRPAIGAVLPTAKGHTVLLDVGANVDCKPINFVHFAIMGSAYAKAVLGIKNPKVGLLSIGEEDVKGNEMTKSVFSMLKETPTINFIGNAEGKELFKGAFDVIVCDGFAGNVALKVSESVASYMSKLLKEELTRTWYTKLGALIAKSAFNRVRKRADYTEYGGAPLLGVKGITIIGHGSSNANAVKNAIRVARDMVEHQLNQHIEEDVAQAIGLLNVDKHSGFWNNIKDKIIPRTT